MTETVVTTAKVVSAGGIGMALMTFFNDTETIFLIITGLFSSLTSYFYDWVHRHPRAFGIKEVSEVLKYCFYGLSMMFVIYFYGINNGSEYIDLPQSSWGFIAALCAGSAVEIVEFGSKLVAKFATKKAR